MQKYVIVVAGGKGERFLTTIPKQFIELAGEPVLMRSIKVFYDCFPEIKIVVALPEMYYKLWEQLCDKYDFAIHHSVSKGGETRFHSVKKALEFVGENGIVAVHDAVRPIVSSDLIVKSFSEAEKFDNAVPAVPVNDSVRLLDNGQYKIIEREKIKIIQTPQCFKASIIKKAYQQTYIESFTDDASVVEASGEDIHIIEGDHNNIKITRSIDLLIAERLLHEE